MQFLQEFLTVCEALEVAKIEYAVCGGLAVAIHGYPRHTRDIDILVREDDLETMKVVVAKLGFDLETGWISFHVGTPEEERLFRLTKTIGPEFLTLDLIVVTAALKEVWNDRIQYFVGDRTLTVVSKNGLITMKKIAGRVVDLQDIERLQHGDKSNESAQL